MAERLASLPQDERDRIEASLTQEQRKALIWDWDFWARPDQKVPDDCSIYVRSAGRGSGKTREGSEWARKKGPAHREGLLIGANPRDARDLMIEGRALALDTMVPTPDGWTTMGALREGDTVIGGDGRPCTVTCAFPVRMEGPCFRVGFEGGASVVADGDHLWLTENFNARVNAAATGRFYGSAVTTDHMRETLWYTKGSVRQANHAIRVAPPVDFELPADLPLDPYLLGAWLGDGNTRDAAITTADPEMLEPFVEAGYVVRKRKDALGQGAAHTYGIRRGMLRDLRRAGVQGNKHVPTAYLRASAEVRLAVVQGLMDTDGTVSAAGQCDFAVTLPHLAESMVELLCSLGIKASAIIERPPSLHHRRPSPSYRVRFTTTLPVFRLQRKLDRLRQRTRDHRHWFVRTVDAVDSVPVRCITVDSPDHTFLVTRHFIKTHNSGIVTVSPPWERPAYEPTKLLLRWPNGAIAHVRSAEDPASIRGLSVDWCWCFRAGTLVRTERGDIPIETVHPGTRVWTRQGWRSTTHLLSRRTDAVIEMRWAGGTLVGTPEHPIWTTRGWISMGDVRVGDTIATWKGSSTGTVSAGTSTSETATTEIAEASCTTGRSTHRSMAQFRTDSTFTTATRTGPTTSHRTSWRSARPTTWRTMRTEGSRASLLLPGAAGWPARGSVPRPGATPVSSAASRHSGGPMAPIPTLATALTSVDDWHGSTSSGVVLAALHASPLSATARRPAVTAAPMFGHRTPWSVPVPSAGSPSRPEAAGPVPPELALERVEHISRGSTDEQVWDLRVDGTHEYLANGVLAHNCDEIVKWRFLQQTWDQSRLALREGRKPQTVVTTTPMPLPLIRKLLAGGRGILVRPAVSTYRNRANLSPDWFQELLDSFEGTRLGDQELHAVVLDDVKGAIWTHAQIEAARWDGAWVKTPSGIEVPALALRRRVVGVDPSGSTTGDEWGIVVVGTDGRRPPCGFVLDDRSQRGTPEECARAAVRAYWEHNCEALVVEINYGGEMVERVVRAVPAEAGFPSGETVRVEVVRAGRGQSKYERAVPVHSLFEQTQRGFKRFQMVGVYKELEDQMTTWIPPEQADGIEVFASKWSPDRMDAMVWASLWLLVMNPRVQGRAETKTLHSATIG